jgi:hypothetical protein
MLDQHSHWLGDVRIVVSPEDRHALYLDAHQFVCRILDS